MKEYGTTGVQPAAVRHSPTSRPRCGACGTVSISKGVVFSRRGQVGCSCLFGGVLLLFGRSTNVFFSSFWPRSPFAVTWLVFTIAPSSFGCAFSSRHDFSHLSSLIMELDIEEDTHILSSARVRSSPLWRCLTHRHPRDVSRAIIV